MSSISSLTGSSSGSSSSSSSSITGQLDVQYIVEQIIYSKQEPIRDLEEYQTIYKAKRTAFQTLNTKASAVESALQSLINSGFSAKSATSDDDSLFTATATSAADAGSTSIIVRQLAKAQSDSSTGLASKSDLLLTDGTTFSITQGGVTRDIQITGQTRSLTGLKNAINNSGLDVMATVIYDGSQYKLQVTSRSTGTENGFTITDTDVGTSVSTKVAAQDAWINVNSTAEEDKIVRSSNTIDDVISGVTLNLKKADASSAVNLNVASDTAGFQDKLDTFVTAFNEAIDFLNTQFEYDTETGTAGVLSGESAARKVQTDLLGLVTSRVGGLSSTDSYASLASIGLTIDTEGKLEVDSDKVSTALTNDFDAVQRLFKDMGTSSTSDVSYFSKTAATKAGQYDVNVTRAAEQAILTGATAMGPVAAGGETLTISLGSRSVGVTLDAGLTASEIVARINSVLSEEGLAVTASKEFSAGSDYLRLVSNEYGSAQTLKVVSDSTATGSGIGTTLLTDTGVDVAGTIDGQAATGNGKILTADSGDASGLSVLTDGVSLGDLGSITVTQGIGERLRQQLYELTFPYSGLLAKTIAALDDQLEGISDKISDINRQLATEEETLIAQFTKANEALSEMESVLSSLNDIK